MSSERLFAPSGNDDYRRRSLDELVDKGFDDLIGVSKENAYAITKSIDSSLGDILGSRRDHEYQMQMMQYQAMETIGRMQSSNYDLASGLDQVNRNLVSKLRQLLHSSQDSNFELTRILEMLKKIGGIQTEQLGDISSSLHFINHNLLGLGNQIQTGFDKVIKSLFRSEGTLQNIADTMLQPAQTAALEKHKHGKNALANGWNEEALEDFLKSLEGYKYQPDIWAYVGFLYRNLLPEKNLGEAIRAFLYAAKYSAPTSASFAVANYQEAANTYLELNSPSEAYSCIESAIGLEPNNSNLHYQAAKLSVKIARPDHLAHHLYTALKLEPQLSLLVSTNQDFAKYNAICTKVIKQLRTEAKKSADLPKIASIFSKFLELGNIDSALAQKILDIHSNISNLKNENTYLGFLQIASLRGEIEKLLEAHIQKVQKIKATKETEEAKKRKSLEDQLRKSNEEADKKLAKKDEEINNLRQKPNAKARTKAHRFSKDSYEDTVDEYTSKIYKPSREFTQALAVSPMCEIFVKTLSMNTTFRLQGKTPIYDGKDREKYTKDFREYLHQNLINFIDYFFSSLVRVLDQQFPRNKNQLPSNSIDFEKVRQISILLMWLSQKRELRIFVKEILKMNTESNLISAGSNIDVGNLSSTDLLKIVPINDLLSFFGLRDIPSRIQQDFNNGVNRELFTLIYTLKNEYAKYISPIISHFKVLQQAK